MNIRSGYEVFEPITDPGLRLWGPDLSSLFVEAARGFTSLLTEVDLIRPVEEREMEIRAKDPDGLMVAWLNEILYLFESEGFLVEAVSIRETDLWHVKAAVLGESYDPDRHKVKSSVRSLSYSNVCVKKGDDGWEARVHLTS